MIEIDENNLDAIVNPDDPELTQVNATVTPYSKITLLRLGRDTTGDGNINTWAIGTGFMVASDIMVTAAHCMYNSTYGTIQQMRIYKKQNSSTLNSTYYYPAAWYIPQQYTSSEDANYDWCIIKLQTGIGNDTGWFGYNIPYFFKNVTVSGYPAASGYTYYQYKNGPKLLRFINTKRCKYACNTLGGQSGAPVFDNNDVVWAIHNGTYNSTTNAGCRITKEIYDLIQSLS